LRLLFIIPYAPTPIRTRPYNLLRSLARRGHAVTLATVWENQAEREALTELAHLGIRVIAEPLTPSHKLRNLAQALLGDEPLQAHYSWQPALAQKLLTLLPNTQYPLSTTQYPNTQSPSSPFHIIHIEHLRGACYGLFLKSQTPNTQYSIPNIQYPISNTQYPIPNTQPPIFWDAVDSITHLFEQAAARGPTLKTRLITRFELPRTRRYETHLLTQFDHILVTSPIDKTAFQVLGTEVRGQRSEVRGQNPSVENQTPSISSTQYPIPNTQYPISILPNGVDFAYFTPPQAPRQTNALVFTGKMSYHANIAAAAHLVETIMPQVWKRRPDVNVWIVGKDPPPRVRRLGVMEDSIFGYRSKKARGRVFITGAVHSLRLYLQAATIVVAPMVYGAGIQNKILEAMACAAPVIAYETALDSLQAQPEQHLLTAREPAHFAQQILRLLDDPALQQRLGNAGRRYVEQHHNWDAIAANLERLYAIALEPNP